MLLSRITFDLSLITNFGITVAIVGMVIVFAALVILLWVFNSIPKLLKVFVRWKLRKQGKPKDHEIMDLEGNIAAAIGLALHLHFKKPHDDESGIITIKRISRQYSPWSSKIYSTNSFFRSGKI
ncbi:MAG: OadG family protein [Bacteroidales bacterium]|jgi:Na+-transporting methylmalonyl-CoA/oxaloacetate decarboxylase gamma subunit|nr:OadG family protein [Bacteroidales bacterium]HOF81622.1 OadG family protein [Bacteroidales bacterium]HOR76909.1 OadG family protein [Bacteroidales bacterium]HPL12333.1 OadG family protein [Bacteroidales bacterium]